MLCFCRFYCLLCLLCVLQLPVGAAAQDRCRERPVALSEERPLPFEQNGLWGYRIAAGDVLIAPQFQFAGEFSDLGLAGVYRGTEPAGWHYIDITGASIIRPLAYDNGPDPFAEGLARYKRHQKIGFFDERGCIVIEAEFDWAFPFSEGRAAVCKGCMVIEGRHSGEIAGGKWGYVDVTGDVVIPLRYGRASKFEAGRAAVEIEGKSHIIDRSGNPLE